MSDAGWDKVGYLNLLVVAAMLCVFTAFAEESRVVLREDFDILDAWRPLVFGKIGRHTRYDVVEEGTTRIQEHGYEETE